MVWNEGLTGPVLNIAQTKANPLRVMAGPGTGKTFAMKRRVARLLEEGSEATRILAVTFTRTAAANLIRELRDIDIPNCENVRACTLHSFCFSLLSRGDVFEVLARSPRSVITFKKSGVIQFEGAPLLCDLQEINGFGDKRECCRRITAFEAAWARLQSDTPGWPTDPIDKKFHLALINWLKYHNAMMIGELVPEALQYLRNNPMAFELSSYEHVIVDEFQDLNKAEQELIDLLSVNSNLTIIGDVDQSIYRFRYAHPQGISTFNASHPDTHDEGLLECRRCPAGVVVIADHLIRNNYDANHDSRLRPYPDNPEGDIYIIQWPSLNEEAEGLAQYIHFILSEGRYLPNDIIVLASRRMIGYGIHDSLRTRGISTHSYFQNELANSAQAQFAFEVMNLLCNPNDLVALRYCLGFGSNTWLSRQYRILVDHCLSCGDSPLEALEKVSSRDSTLTGISHLTHNYGILKSRLDDLRTLEIPEQIGRLFPSDEDWAGPVRELILPHIDTDTDLNDIFDLIRGNLTRQEIPDEGDFVRIMSLHAAKGLTSKVVLIAGCIQSLIPTVSRNLSDLEQEAELEEQRRLFYVAITRCSDILVISSAITIDRGLGHKMGARLTGGDRIVGKTMASQFVAELGPSAPRAIRGHTWLDSLGIGD